ncbi:hypothetical protein BC834DRAFT_973384 [Gloeopeniophorella convolvens]|nr:hypothetical protein BC834DRAFT_973384 [Gloeopeniophorella convolvens]
MLRAPSLGLQHSLRGFTISNSPRPWRILRARAHPYSTAHRLIDQPKQKEQQRPPTERMSPAAIVSAMHQHIAYGATWDVGAKDADATLRSGTPSDSADTAPTTAPAPAAATTTTTTTDRPRPRGWVKPLEGRNTSAGLPLKRAPSVPTTTPADLAALADALDAHFAHTNSPAALPRLYTTQSLRPRLLALLAHTQCADSAWHAFRALARLPCAPAHPAPKVPLAHRHRLLRLLAAAPAARGASARVLAALRALRAAGGTVQRWEWNVLLDRAAREGLRRPREAHVRGALALLRAAPPEGTPPDAVAHSALLAAAVRARAPRAVRHAAGLLARAGAGAASAHAHVALLGFFAARGELQGVRGVLRAMRAQGVRLAQGAPFNAALWAFARNGRLDVAGAMYRVVRARMRHGEEEEEEEEEEGGEIAELERALEEREMVAIPRGVVPDVATYTIMVQAHAYRGDLRAALGALADMLGALPLPPPTHATSPPGAFSAPAATHPEDDDPDAPPTAAAFRALFLGFARHGAPPHSSAGSAWTHDALRALLARFLEQPRGRSAPRERTLFWLVGGLARTSGDDARVLARALAALEARFGVRWRGRLARVRERVHGALPAGEVDAIRAEAEAEAAQRARDA